MTHQKGCKPRNDEADEEGVTGNTVIVLLNAREVLRLLLEVDWLRENYQNDENGQSN